LSEFTELQNSYAKTAFDTAVSEATRLSELALRVTNETIEPLHTQMTAAIEKIAKPVLSA
jgi:phasin family protein